MKERDTGTLVWKGLKRPKFYLKRRTPFSFQLLQAPKNWAPNSPLINAWTTILSTVRVYVFHEQIPLNVSKNWARMH
jgi:hypothetical protein